MVVLTVPLTVMYQYRTKNRRFEDRTKDFFLPFSFSFFSARRRATGEPVESILDGQQPHHYPSKSTSNHKKFLAL
jgi:hypothetical protein